MARYQVTYWQEIPSQVDARDDAGKIAKRMLSQRFQQLIDVVATRRQLHTSDEYIAQWNKGAKTERAGTAEEAVQAVCDELEAQFADIRAKAMETSAPEKA
jgi:hypothetical protein